ASGLGTATVRATVGGVSGTTTVVTQSSTPAENVANPLPGLEYSYYEATSFTAVPNFDTLTPVKSGLTPNFSLTGLANRSTQYALQWTGLVYAPAAATYTFYTNSDDGSKLWVGGQLVVNNDGKHAATEKSGQIILDTGWHSFQLGYLQASGGATLTWAYQSASIGKGSPPDTSLEHL